VRPGGAPASPGLGAAKLFVGSMVGRGAVELDRGSTRRWSSPTARLASIRRSTRLPPHRPLEELWVTTMVGAIGCGSSSARSALAARSVVAPAARVLKTEKTVDICENRSYRTDSVGKTTGLPRFRPVQPKLKNLD
jgi:hypothetical protein